MNTINVQNPKVLLLPEIQDLLQRMLNSRAMLSPTNLVEVAPELYEYVTSDDGWLVLGSDGGDWKGVTLGHFPTGKFFPYPLVSVFYNEGSRALARALSRETLDIVANRGYTRAVALNGSGRPDKVWQRAILPEGVTARPLGSTLMLEV